MAHIPYVGHDVARGLPAELSRRFGSAELPRALARDYRSASLSEADRAMLDYAVKLTRAPAAAGADGAEGLRHLGFDDTSIPDICQVTSYCNDVNRLADGRGVEPDETWTPGELTLTPAEVQAGKASRDSANGGEGEES